MNKIETLRKKLYFRSRFRGTKELDIIIGRFAEKHVKSMAEDELTIFENLIALDEISLANYLIYNHPAPQKYATVIEEIKSIPV